jgi:hypothetical protein
MGTRGPPQAPPRRLTALRRRQLWAPTRYPPIWRNLAAQLGAQPRFRSELSARSPVATRRPPNLAEDKRGNVLNLGEMARKRSKGDILHQGMPVA